MDIEWKDLEKVYEMLDGVSMTAEEIKNTILTDIAEQIVYEARNILQSEGHIVTGQLLASIRILEQGENYVIVGSDKQHALWLEIGRGPVRPIKGKYLHWIDPDTGKDVFATYAGPTEPTHFFERAYLKVVGKINNLVVDKLEQGH